jgi:acyl-coenzyme A synthetase/AMP-(fatty) acid ligase
MKILDYIAGLGEQEIALCTNSETVFFKDISRQIGNDHLRSIAGLRVAFSLSSVAVAVKAIALLDGNADAIIFLSHALSIEQTVELAQIGQVDVLLTDRKDLEGQCGTINVVHDVASLMTCSPRNRRSELDHTQWIMTTSGTTGVPKMIVHSLESLCRTTKIDKPQTPVIWALLYDYSRFAGMQVILQSLLSGATLVAPDEDLPLNEKVQFFVRMGCTHASATPTLWRNILMLPDAKCWPLRSIALGGEIADGRVLRNLAGQYPSARVTHIYASTEAGVGFSVSDGRPGFPAAFLSAPPAGIELKVNDGKLFVRNNNVGAEYLGTNESFKSLDGWVNTGDVVEISDDRVIFQGRESGTINVGGNKVTPETVENALLSHGSVAIAHVYAKKNPFSGNVVAAEVVLRPNIAGLSEIKKSIFNHLHQTLESFQIPATIKFVDQIPLNSAGKVSRSI